MEDNNHREMEVLSRIITDMATSDSWSSTVACALLSILDDAVQLAPLRELVQLFAAGVRLGTLVTLNTEVRISMVTDCDDPACEKCERVFVVERGDDVYTAQSLFEAVVAVEGVCSG